MNILNTLHLVVSFINTYKSHTHIVHIQQKYNCFEDCLKYLLLNSSSDFEATYIIYHGFEFSSWNGATLIVRHVIGIDFKRPFFQTKQMWLINQELDCFLSHLTSLLVINNYI